MGLGAIFNAKVFYISFIVLIVSGLAITALYSGSTGSSNLPEIETEDPSAEPTPASAYFFPDGPARTIDASKPHIAMIKTSKGDIKIQLATDAPQAVNSFAFLAGRGFYDQTTFFYVDKAFVAQAGDPTCRVESDAPCSGVGGPGYDLAVEQGSSVHKQWSVAAPSLGEGRQTVHGSQFRIFYDEDARLDGKETILGTVVEGQQILESLDQFTPCTFSDVPDCAGDLAGALVIDEIIVQPA